VHRRTNGVRRGEVTRSRRRLHDVEFHYLYPSPNCIREVKLWLICAGYVVHMGQKCTECFDEENLRKKDNFQNLGVDGILKWVLKMQGSRFEYLE